MHYIYYTYIHTDDQFYHQLLILYIHSTIKIDTQIYPKNDKSIIHKNALRHIYSTDQIVRRAKSLNQTNQAINRQIYISKDLVKDNPNKKTLHIEENEKFFKISEFKVKDDLPNRTIVYNSSFDNKFTESKSTFVSLKK